MKKFKDKIKLVDNIPDWPGYHVTPEGEVWSRHKMVRYSFVLGDKGYLMNVRLKGRKGINRFNENTGRPFVNLSRYEDGHYIQKKVLVHRLVALTYIPNPENKPCVCHKDNNRTNNRVENLYWGTVKENMSQASRDGRMLGPSTSLENHSRSKLTNYQRIRIIYLYKNKGFTYRQLAEKFNVSVGCISSVIKNPNCIKLYEKKYQ